MTTKTNRKLDFQEQLNVQELEDMIQRLRANKFGTAKERSECEIRAIHLSRLLRGAQNQRVDNAKVALDRAIGARRNEQSKQP